MTREEAIKHFESYVGNECYTANHQNACKMAIAALRAQQTPVKLDRSRWEGCEYCKMESPLFSEEDSVISIGHYNIIGGAAIEIKDIGAFSVNFCPICGRPLTDVAWAGLESMVGGGDETNNT